MLHLPSGIALISGTLVSLLLTPIDFRLARVLGAIDIPTDSRRMHCRPIPRLGGISIFFSFLLLSLVLCFRIAESLFFAWAAAILLVCVGVLDDILSLPPFLKLFAQAGAAWVSTFGGNLVPIARWPPISLSLTLLWLLTLINAHNFIDGLDGLCGGVSAIESATLGLISLRCGEPQLSAIAFLLCGATLGFLPYNIKGARIFMGDCGSTFLGFTLAWLSVALLRRSSPPNLACLPLLFAVPLADISFAVLRRLSKGKSPFAPDRSHIHHILADTALGHFGASRLLCLIAALTAATAYLLS